MIKLTVSGQQFLCLGHTLLAVGIEAAKEWQGFENYTFKDIDGQTELTVEMDSKKDYKDYFSKVWPKALERLKELVEK